MCGIHSQPLHDQMWLEPKVRFCFHPWENKSFWEAPPCVKTKQNKTRLSASSINEILGWGPKQVQQILSLEMWPGPLWGALGPRISFPVANRDHSPTSLLPSHSRLASDTLPPGPFPPAGSGFLIYGQDGTIKPVFLISQNKVSTLPPQAKRGFQRPLPFLAPRP